MPALKSIFTQLPSTKITRGIEKKLAGLSAARQCNNCKKKCSHFRAFTRGGAKKSDWLKKIEYTDYDRSNDFCMYCGCNDRTRHIMLYFDKLNFWDTLKKSRLLHIAPERELVKKIVQAGPLQYTLGDIEFTQPPYAKKMNLHIEKVDVTEIPFPDASFDVFISMHVLEHVPDYKKAFSEIHRILRPGGTAILQVPISNFLSKHFTDPSIQTDQDMYFFYGTAKHVRVFSEKQYIADLDEAGFANAIVRHTDVSTKEEAIYHGVNAAEALLMFTKK